MGFLKNIIRSAVDDGISKGIRDAVSSATEKIIAPKAEEYANSVADSLDEATKAVNSAPTSEKNSSLEQSMDRLSDAAERYAAAMEGAVEQTKSYIDEWKEKIPDFPVWCFGGTDFWFSDCGTDAYGSTYHIFNVDNATQEGLDAYVELLKQNGFVRKYSTSDEVLYKEVDGEYLVFGKTEAFNAAPLMSIALYRTRDKSEIEI